MSYPTSPVDHSAVAQKALTFIREKTKRSKACPEQLEYVPWNPLQEYFTQSKIQEILSSTYDNIEDWERHARIVVRNQYVKVFVILLQLRCPDSIIHFHSDDDLADRNLPYRSQPHGFPTGVPWPEFREKARSLCPASFSERHVDFKSEQRLPIENRDFVVDGTSAIIEKIKIEPDYVSFEGRMVNNRYMPHTHIYALKTFCGDDAEKYFNVERDAYERVSRVCKTLPMSLAKCYATFTYHGKFHIIMDYADYEQARSLEEFMQKLSPPSHPTEVRQVWTALLELGQAVQLIHLAKGWHQDINPENIVLKQRALPACGTYECYMMLIDLGRAYFGEGTESQKVRLGRDQFGTRPYGAMECYRADFFAQTTQLWTSPKADLFSLACVWLEAAVWMQEGMAGVRAFRARRLKEAWSRGGMERGQPFFHVDNQLMACVDDQIAALRRNARGSDPITPRVCDELLPRMLDRNLASRLEAKEVWLLASRILRTTASQDNGSVLNSILPGPQSQEPTSISRGTTFADINSLDTYGQPSGVPSIFLGPTDASTTAQTPGSSRTWTLPDRRDAEVEFLNHSGASSQVAHTQSQRIVNDGPPIARNTVKAKDKRPFFPFGKSRKVPGGPDISQSSISNADQTIRARKNEIQRPPPMYELSRNSTRARNNETQRPPPGYELSRNIARFDVSQGFRWKWDKARGVDSPIPGEKQLKPMLIERDHVFILDNSRSGQIHKGEMLDLLELLACIVKDTDPDGIDLHFTGTESCFMAVQDPERLVRQAKLEPWTSNHQKDGVREALQRATEKHLSKLRSANEEWKRTMDPKGPKKVWPLSIYFLTDGKWIGSFGAIPFILDLIEQLVELKMSRQQIGLQFIGFGDDAEGLDHLQKIDNMHKQDGGYGLKLDLVDYEKSNGDVWKMLLGPISDFWDNSS